MSNIDLSNLTTSQLRLELRKLDAKSKFRTLKTQDWSACVNTINDVKALIEKHQIEINHDQKHNTPADLILAGMIMMEQMILGDGTCSIDGYQMFVDGDYNNDYVYPL